MKLEAIQLNSDQQRKLAEIFQSDGIELVFRAIEARIFELTHELGEASTMAQAEGADLANRVPRAQEKLVAVLRWKAAHEVLAEMASQKSSPVLEWRVTV